MKMGDMQKDGNQTRFTLLISNAEHHFYGVVPSTKTLELNSNAL